MVKNLFPNCSKLFLHWTVAIISYHFCITNCSWNILNLKLKIGDRVRISKNDLPFQKGYKTQFTDEIFEILTISTKKLPTYIIKDLKKEKFWENFMRKSWKKVQIKDKSFFKLNFYRSVVMESFTIELIFNATFSFYTKNCLSSFKNFLPKQKTS